MPGNTSRSCVYGRRHTRALSSQQPRSQIKLLSQRSQGVSHPCANPRDSINDNRTFQPRIQEATWFGRPGNHVEARLTTASGHMPTM